MIDNEAQMLEKLGEEFGISGKLKSFKELKNGNINKTYKVDYTENGKEASYLFQRINTTAFTKPVELMENIDKVTRHIEKKKDVCLRYRVAKDGKNYVEDETGFWRVCNYIKSVTFDNGKNKDAVKRAGEAFGEFQTILSDFDADKLHYTIPDFHNTIKRYEAFKKAVKEDVCGRLCECKNEAEWLISVEDKACVLTELFEEGKLPLRVTHNDTKINNVLFDETTFAPLAVIDLDTVMPGLVGHDFGDAIRSAANYADEDEEDLNKVGLNLETFYAFADGYLKNTAKSLTDEEISTLAASCFAITCEQATRFLADYLNGDLYYKIKRDKHNLVRVRAQIALAKSILQNIDKMNSICMELKEKYI